MEFITERDDLDRSGNLILVRRFSSVEKMMRLGNYWAKRFELMESLELSIPSPKIWDPERIQDIQPGLGFWGF